MFCYVNNSQNSESILTICQFITMHCAAMSFTVINKIDPINILNWFDIEKLNEKLELYVSLLFWVVPRFPLSIHDSKIRFPLYNIILEPHTLIWSIYSLHVYLFCYIEWERCNAISNFNKQFIEQNSYTVGSVEAM